MLGLIFAGLAMLIDILLMVFLIVLTFKQIVSWFRERQSLVESDRDNVAFTVKKGLEGGNYELVQGVFNTNSEEVVDARKISTERMDSEMTQIHKRKKLALYQ